MEPLWFRMMDFARAQGLSYGLGIDRTAGKVVAFVGRAMGVGSTSNEAINLCADQMVAAHGWQDDRNG